MVDLDRQAARLDAARARVLAEVIDAALARLGGDVDAVTRAEAQAFLVHHGGGHTP